MCLTRWKMYAWFSPTFPVHDFISVEAMSPEDHHYIAGNAKYRIFCRICSPRILRRRTPLIIVRQGQRAMLTAHAQWTNWCEVLTIPAWSRCERGAGADTYALSGLSKQPSHDREGSEHSRKQQKLISPPSHKRAQETESPGPSTKRLTLVVDGHSYSDTEEEWHCFNPEMEREDENSKQKFRKQLRSRKAFSQVTA